MFDFFKENFQVLSILAAYARADEMEIRRRKEMANQVKLLRD